MKRTGSVIEETYQNAMEGEMKTLGAQVEAMKEEAEKMGGELKTEFNQSKEALRSKQFMATQLLENLKYVTGDIWKGLKEGFEIAVADLKESITKVHPARLIIGINSPVLLPVKPII
jgi:hypothetical protein